MLEHTCRETLSLLQREPPGVRPDFWKKNCVAHRPMLLLAAVLLYVLLPGGTVSASSMSRGGGFDFEAHSHYCKCASCRGSSCCCGPTEAMARPFAPEPIPPGSEADTGPCLNSAPCGDSGLPSSPSAGRLTKVAALPMSAHPLAGTPGRLFLSSSRCILPARRASRLDEPPEGLVVA